MLVLLITLFFICNPINGSQKAHPQLKHDIISFHYMSPISKTDFRNIGEASLIRTFTPTTPGTFIFVDHIGFQGASSLNTSGGNTAFFISSDNLVIDLGGKTLYQNSSNQNTNGIEINANQKNITIKNGSIVGFKGAGIYVRPGCDNIRLQQIVISNCGKQGIYFAGSSASGNDISNCIIEDCSISRTVGTAAVTQAVGLQLDYCNNIFIKNCLFGQSDGTVLSKDAIGALIQNSNTIIFEQCDASLNKGLNSYGFKITGTDTGSTACSFFRCSASNNTGTNSTAGGNGYGFYAQSINSCAFNHCIALGNSGTKNGYGFYYNATRYTHTVSCQSDYNKAGSFATTTTDGSRGFYATAGIGNEFITCLSKGNQGNTSNASSMAIGFDLQSEVYPVMNECYSHSHGSQTSSYWSVGIQLSDCTQAMIKKCHSFNNRSTTLSQAYGIRDTSTQSNALIIDCFFYGNGQGSTTSNFSVTYPNQGELNTTAPVAAGGISGIALVKPFQNVTITS